VVAVGVKTKHITTVATVIAECLLLMSVTLKVNLVCGIVAKDTQGIDKQYCLGYTIVVVYCFNKRKE
jgi:hypothetical protein